MSVCCLSEERAGEHDDATDSGGREEACAEPGGQKSDGHGQGSHPDGTGGVDDGGEGHDGECYVGHVEEEGLHEPVLDGLADERQRKDADGIGDRKHEEDVKVDVIHAHPPFPVPRP